MRSSSTIGLAASVCLLFTVTGCGITSSPKAEPTFTNQKPLIEEAYNIAQKASSQKETPPLKLESFKENGCKDFQPYNEETKWQFEGTYPGKDGGATARELAAIYQKNGWKFGEDLRWLDGTKPNPSGDPEMFVNARLEKGNAAVSLYLAKLEPGILRIYARTPCVPQPVNRTVETDPADPGYKTPTPSTTSPNRTQPSSL